jgi:hypothetical protein
MKQRRAPRTRGELNKGTILSLLGRASRISTLGEESEEEVYFMNNKGTRSRLESGITLYGPVITKIQQQFSGSSTKADS